MKKAEPVAKRPEVVKATPTPAPGPPVKKAEPVPVRSAVAVPVKPAIPAGGSSGAPTPQDFSSYHQIIHDAIYRNWAQPRGLYTGNRVYTKVNLTIRKDGTILSPRLVAGSGHQAMDQSVLDAVLRTGKIPPLPNGLGGATYNVTINFQLD
ncbi:MAG: energy transducer TonB [Verrucomicrobiales bacterium]